VFEDCAGTEQHGANTASCLLRTLSFTLFPAKVQNDGMHWSGLRVRLVGAAIVKSSQNKRLISLWKHRIDCTLAKNARNLIVFVCFESSSLLSVAYLGIGTLIASVTAAHVRAVRTQRCDLQ
jgi:hypothetical protein